MWVMCEEKIWVCFDGDEGKVGKNGTMVKTHRRET